MKADVIVQLLAAIQEWHEEKNSEYVIEIMNELKDYFVDLLIGEKDPEETENFKRFLRLIFNVNYHVKKLIPKETES